MSGKTVFEHVPVAKVAAFWDRRPCNIHHSPKEVLWILLTYGKGRFWRLFGLVARHSEAQRWCPITYTYSRGEARKLLERRGFA